MTDFIRRFDLTDVTHQAVKKPGKICG